jgi:hypothetical protein
MYSPKVSQNQSIDNTMTMRTAIGLTSLALLSACASPPTAPPETLISVQLKGTAVEVQQFIEDRIRRTLGNAFRVENASDRSITFKGDCMATPNMNAFKCAAVMMAVGNSRWDGPHAVLTFRTSDVRGLVNVTATSDWCATNAFGKTNCMPNASNAELNTLLRSLDQAYQTEVRPTQ